LGDEIQVYSIFPTLAEMKAYNSQLDHCANQNPEGGERCDLTTNGLFKRLSISSGDPHRSMQLQGLHSDALDGIFLFEPWFCRKMIEQSKLDLSTWKKPPEKNTLEFHHAWRETSEMPFLNT
jgi:hypothetical protein